MMNFNELRIVGVDLGYGNIKTAHTSFPTGLTVHESEPVFAGNILKKGFERAALMQLQKKSAKSGGCN